MLKKLKKIKKAYLMALILLLTVSIGCRKGDPIGSSFNGNWTYTAAGGGSLEKLKLKNGDDCIYYKCEKNNFGCVNYSACFDCKQVDKGSASIKMGIYI
jgi:hypothetical protein